jgi:hypothetical protein
MTFKSRYKGSKRCINVLVCFTFTASTVEEAIKILKEKETRLKRPIRCYEVESKCRIVGGKLEKVKYENN